MTITVPHVTAANTLTPTIPATTAGRNLIVCINSFNASSPAVTSVKLGTVAMAQAISKIQSASGFCSSWIYYLGNIAAGQTAVTIAGSNLSVDTGSGGVDILEVAGLKNSSQLDKSNFGSAASGTAWTSNSTGTLSQSDELVVGTADGFGMSDAAGWTMVTGGGTSRRTGYKIVSANTAQTFNSTQTFSTWAAVIASFAASKPAKGLLDILSMM